MIGDNNPVQYCEGAHGDRHGVSIGSAQYKYRLLTM